MPEYASVIFVYSNFVGTAYYDTRVCKHPSGTDQFADDRRYFDFFVSVILYESVGYDVVPKGNWQGKYPHNRIVFSIVFDSWTDDGTIYCMVSGGLLLGCKKRLEKDNRNKRWQRYFCTGRKHRKTGICGSFGDIDSCICSTSDGNSCI